MPEKYGKWRILKSLSEGGQAHTFLACEIGDSTRRLHVLKRLKNVARIGRFANEVEAGLKLDHPNVAKVLDYRIDAEPAYLVTEYYPGGELTAAALEKNGLLERLQVFLGICSGVGHAHDHGITHRDLKPSNILLKKDGAPVVSDFGICFLSDEGERVTVTEEVVGPLHYVAPELEDGRVDVVGPQSDVYSLGKLLYWILTGHIFSREKHREEKFNLTRNYTDVGYYFVNQLLDKMIVSDPTQRLRDAGAVEQEVGAMMERIEKGKHVIDRDAPQPCNYCGVGSYQIVADFDPDGGHRLGFDETSVQNFGLNLVGSPVFLIMACDHCGNCQLFRPDLGKNPAIWRKKGE